MPPPADSRLRRLRRALYRLYYRVKYFPFAAERRRRREDTRRGFVVIQVDALAHEDLERALRRGWMPNVRRLLEKHGWQLRRYPAGLPSATPAAQAAIFYGTKERIPAFRFYEKTDRRIIIGSQPASMQYIRDRLPRDGVLEGGSSYVNLFDGGAARAVFTLSDRKAPTLLGRMGGGRLALLLLLHPLRMVRMLVAGLWSYLLEERDRLISQMKGRSTWYWWYLPLMHIGTNVVLRELQTLIVLLDIYSGAPSIYTTYNLYDEFAHHFGPSSRTALKNLKYLDARIGEILRMLHRLPGRPYDLFILSDHGQTPSVPYRVRYGETLGDTILGAVHHGVTTMASTGDYGPTGEALQLLVRELEQVAETSSPPARHVGLRLGRWIRSHYKLFPLVAETVRAAPRDQLVVTYSSSLAHVYWTEPARPLSFPEIRGDPAKRALYYFLITHRGIGPIVTRLLDGAHVETERGRALLAADLTYEVLEGDDPLEGYATGDIERRALLHLAHLPNAGDLILLGAYDPKSDVCVCFDDQVGAHGGLGGRQFWPFVMAAPGVIPPGYVIEDPLDIHPLLARYRAGAGRVEDRGRGAGHPPANR